MFVDESSSTQAGRTYKRYLLRESYRENGKVLHRTVANISHCSAEEIQAIRLALRHKEDLGSLLEETQSVQTVQGLSVGAVWLIFDIARQLGIEQALGRSRQGRLALWQVIARVLDQGSRLSAVRLAGSHAACDVLGIQKTFNEESLYENLDWLCAQQARIEKFLFEKTHCAAQDAGLFLYDVTSSYLEGTENELAAFGYNRDGKRGKKQIVIGLLCNGQGVPLSIEVFAGNTQDPKTVASQILKIAERFEAREVTLVGDRGMLKSQQVEALGQRGFHYITAITKAEIRKLMNQGVIQMELFDEALAEVLTPGGIRYIIRRNPRRALEMVNSRQDKLAALRKKVELRNDYLGGHPRAKVDTALRKLQEYATKLKITAWVIFSEQGNRQVQLAMNEAALAEDSKWDGCYVLKTDVPAHVAGKEIIHARYKDLALVEQAFRISKTVELEMRPIHVRLATRTRGHALVVMLAYRIVRELAHRWAHLDLTVQEGLNELTTLCSTELRTAKRHLCQQIPEPRPSVKSLLDAAGVKLPQALPCTGVTVSTKKKLQERRTST